MSNLKKVCVTGAHGFIAGYVIEELVRQGYMPMATVRHFGEESTIIEQNNVILYQADMVDDSAIYGAVEHADGVIHLAGLLGTAENIRQAAIMNKVNVGGALNVLNACDNFKIPCVFIGVGNYFEYNTYSISKTTAESYGIMYYKNFKTPINIVRALNAIGPRQKWGKINKILPTFINKALRNQDIQVYGGRDKCSVMDLVYAGDVAKVLIEALKNAERGDAGHIYEAGTGVGYKVFDIAEKVINYSGSQSKIVEVPMRFGESEQSKVVAKKPYPIEYRDIDEVIKETIEYYKKQM